MIKDIEPGSESSGVKALTVVDSLVYFTAYTSTWGRELWRTNGTSSGTWLVKDINPGEADAFLGNNDEIFRFGDVLFLSAQEPLHGKELY